MGKCREKGLTQLYRGFMFSRLRFIGLLLFVALVFTVPVVGWRAWAWYDCLPPGLNAEYVGRERCVQCHQREAEQWQTSDHARAMELATPKTVLGNFQDGSCEACGVRSRFFREGDQFMVETAGREGKIEKFAIKYTFGVDPLQQYLVEFPNGRLQPLPLAWHTTGKRWIHLYQQENFHSSEWLYWTNQGMSWNLMCADCHSTNLQKNYDVATDTYHTTWTDMEVSCEACHGPGSIHLAITERSRPFVDRRYGTGLAPLKSKVSQFQVDTCGKCHARRQALTKNFRAGDDFLHHYLPEMLDTPSYHPDGQILEENYEYSSFQLSLMCQKGVRCTDCHDPHTSRLRAQGNALCNRCHVPAKFDVPSHHFHKSESTGAQCMNCHMPATTYMVVDPRRDHSFRIPRPELTLAIGTPNACNGCHKEKDAAWARDQLARWRERKTPDLRQNFAWAIAEGRRGNPEARSDLAKLANNTELPWLLRASSLSLLGNLSSPSSIRISKKLLDDSHPMVRMSAVRNLDQGLPLPLLKGDDPRLEVVDVPLAKTAARLLRDEHRMVRIAAARVVSGVPATVLSSDDRKALTDALREYEDSLADNLDDRATHRTLGELHLRLANFHKARKHLEKALVLDPTYHDARLLLARLHYQRGASDQALSTYSEVLTEGDRHWNNIRAHTETRVTRYFSDLAADAHYSMAQILAEDRARLAEAIPHFQKVVKLQPQRHRVLYNLGLACQQLQRWEEADKHLLAARQASPSSWEYVYALVGGYSQRKKITEAMLLLQEWMRAHPEDQDADLMLRQLRNLVPADVPK